MVAVYSTIFALLLATVLVPLFAHYAGALGLLDRPDARKIHHNPVPRVGGIAIAAGALAAVAVWLPPIPEITGYLVGALLIFLAGLLDDRLDLDYRIKFGFQILGALAFIYLGGVQLTRMPFVDGSVLPGWLGVPLTVIVLVAVTNAINLSDGMDGLAGGTSLLAVGAFGYMAYAGGDKIIALMALCLMGGVLGFLRYNTHPARVFMGDSGSQFLGFSAAVLAILLIERSDAGVCPLVPVLVLGLPITDTLQVMTRRILGGRSPFSPDRQHLHHRLLDIGLGQHAAVLLIYLVQVALVVTAWWLRHAPDYVLLGAILLFAATLLLGLRKWERIHAEGGKVLPGIWVDLLVGYLRGSHLLSQIGRRGVLYSVSLLFPVVALLTPGIGADIGWLSLLLFILMASCLIPRAVMPALAIGRLATFTVSALTIYLAESQHLGEVFPMHWLHGYLVLLLMFVALWLRFGGSRHFQLNAMDLLIVLVVAIVPNMPAVRELGIAPMLLESLLLFYASELVLNEATGRWDLLRLSTLAALGILTVRGLLFAAA